MAHRTTKSAICILAVGVVVGCEATQPRHPVEATPPPPSTAVEIPPPPKKPPPPGTTAFAATHPHEPTSQPDGEDDPELQEVGAIGLEESRVRELLGVPVAEENDALAKRLRYHEGACTIEFSMYPDVETRAFRTLTLVVISDDGTTRGKRSCVAKLKSRLAVK